MKEPTKPRREIWHPVPFTQAEAYAVKALADGKADPDQQKRAFNWLTRETRLRDETFVQGKDDATLILQGKRSVGLAIVALMNWTPATRKGD